jgi:hypothetical protein
MDVLENKLWLVKVPELIYKQLTSDNRKRNEVGSLDIFESKNKKNFKILANIDTEGGASCAFDLDYKKIEDNNLFTFSNSERAKGVNVLGKFIATDEKLSDILTKNVRKEEDENKPSVKLETSRVRPQTQGLIKLSEHQYIATNDSREKALIQRNRKEKNLKKTRKDKTELQNEIFQLFSEKKYWTKKELVSKLDQPENYLKDVLLEICNYIKSGPKKSCYELKSQFVSAENENN